MKYYSTSKQSSWPKDILRLYQICKAKGACSAGLTRFVDLLYSERPKSLKELWKAACTRGASVSDLRYVLRLTSGLNIRNGIRTAAREYVQDIHFDGSIEGPALKCAFCTNLLKRSRDSKHCQEVLDIVGPYEVEDIKRLFPDPFRGWYKKQQKKQQKRRTQQKKRRVKT